MGGVADYQDLDPIRRDCLSNDQVCSAPVYSSDGVLIRNEKSLGLVQVINPEFTLPPGASEPTEACSFGQCRFLTTGATTLTCPNGKPQLFGKCFQPVRDLGNGMFTASCINHPDSTCFGATPGQDGRAYNLAVKQANGRYVFDRSNRPMGGAFYRIHATEQTLSATRVMTLGATLCASREARKQIACLSKADKCSLGFGGLQVPLLDDAGVVALPVDSVPLTQATLDAAANLVAGAYPLAARLFFNSVKGFGNVTGDEAALLQCIANKDIVDRALGVAGLMPLSGSDLRCVDNGCGGTTGCANNVAPIFQQR